MNSPKLTGLLILFLAALLTLMGCGEDEGDDSPQGTTDVQLTALIPLTGQLGGYGQQLELALDLALADANAALESNGSSIRLDLQVFDTGTDPATAKTLFEIAVLEGCRYFIGPLTSGETAEISTSTALREAVLFSPASTSQLYAIPDDHIYRMVPPDSLMIRALTEVILYEGNTTLVTMARADRWGIGVAEIVDSVFNALGGNVVGAFEFFAYRRGYYHYILEEIATLLGTVNQPAGTIAIQLSSFEEGNEILAVAREMEGEYPILGQVQWYGSDGMVQNEFLLTMADTCGFAAQTEYLCPVFGFEQGADYDAFVARFNETIAGEPWVYSVISYDAVMLLADVLGEVSDVDDVDAVVSALTDVEYSSLTGSITFDANGDRAGGIFDFYRVVEEGTGYAWELVLTNDNGTITPH